MTPYPYSSEIQTIRESILAKAKASTHIEPWFVSEHLLEVEKHASWLCDLYPNANRDVVGLAVWFHDIGRLEGINDGHDQYGAAEAQKVLSANHFPQDMIDLVTAACAAHRAEEVKPVTIEAKILATADAMSHFIHSFYVRIIESRRKTTEFHQALALIKLKLDRDFNEKISLPEAKAKIKPIYDAWCVILEN
jgi:hypothetical protein